MNNLFAAEAYFAASGTASFHSIYNSSGDGVSAMTYPYDDFDVMSLTLAARFDEGEDVGVEADCLGVEVSQ